MEAKRSPRDIGKKAKSKNLIFKDMLLFLKQNQCFRRCGPRVWSIKSPDIAPTSERHYQKGESGKQDELESEQERRKSEPRAVDKRPKSTERH